MRIFFLLSLTTSLALQAHSASSKSAGSEKSTCICRKLSSRDPYTPYTQGDLADQKSQRNRHVRYAAGYGAATVLAGARRNPFGVAMAGTRTVSEVESAWDAHCDLNEMREHNSKIENQAHAS